MREKLNSFDNAWRRFRSDPSIRSGEGWERGMS